MIVQGFFIQKFNTKFEMKKLITLLFIGFLTTIVKAQSTIPTTTVNGSLRITDSLNVTNDIHSTGDISTSSAITSAGVVSASSFTTSGALNAAGEVTAQDTMRAKKDMLVDGNAVIGGELRVSGISSFNAVSIRGPLTISTASMATINPCIKLLIAEASTTNPLMSNITALSGLQATLLEEALDANPCPTPPVIPFTWQTYGNHVNSNNRWIGTIENFDFNIRTNNALRLSIKNNGNMFFGTKHVQSTHLHANSNYQFDGKVACKEFVVIDPTKWADFVFDKNYQLMPLCEVEQFYKTHKHLPSVPSEQEVKTNGINSAEMDATLLQKIEELTLYLVQQQKEIEALKKQIQK